MRDEIRAVSSPEPSIDLREYYRVVPCEEEPRFAVEYCGSEGGDLNYGPREGNGLWVSQAVALGVETRLLCQEQDSVVIARATACIDEATAWLGKEGNVAIGARLKAALCEYGDLHVKLKTGRRRPCSTGLVRASFPLEQRFALLKLEIITMADQILEEDDPLWPWYRFGAALGAWWLHLRPEGNPLLLELLRSVQEIPPTDIRSCPAMQELAVIAGEASELTECALIERLIQDFRFRAPQLFPEAKADLEAKYARSYPAKKAFLRVCDAYQSVVLEYPPEWEEEEDCDTEADTEEEAGAVIQAPREPSAFGLELNEKIELELNEKNDREVSRAGHGRISLGGRVVLWELLKCLIQSAHHTASRQDLLCAGWGDQSIADGTYHDAVSELRKQVRALGINIRPLRKVGYKLEPA